MRALNKASLEGTRQSVGHAPCGLAELIPNFVISILDAAHYARQHGRYEAKHLIHLKNILAE
jgi:hypothetical protein